MVQPLSITRLALVAVLLFAWASGARAQTCSGTTCLYASPTGAGTTCSLASPCSIDGVVVKAAAVAPTSMTDLTIVLRGGTYALSQTISLGPEHAPGGSLRTVIEAYPGETPVLSGGLPVVGWTPHVGNIYKATAPTGATNRELYVNGIRATRARGYYNRAFVAQLAYGYDLAGFPTAWTYPNDLELVSLSQWKTIRCRVQSFVGGATTQLHVAQPCWNLGNIGVPIYDRGVPDWVENAPELLDEPGEFFVDRNAVPQTIYYIPRPGESMATAVVTIPRLENLVRLRATSAVPASRIVLRGLTFAHTSWEFPNSTTGFVAWQGGFALCDPSFPCPTGAKPSAALLLESANSIRIEGNTFKRLAGLAIDVAGISSNNEIEGNFILDTGSAGIMIGEYIPPTSGPMTGNVVRNNYITDIGRQYYDGTGITLGYAHGTEISHNEFRNLPYTGISAGSFFGNPAGNETQIAHNLVANVMQRLWDGGTMYTVGRQPQSFVTSNYFHSAVNVEGGMYLDGNTEDYSVEHNVITSTQHWLRLQSGFGTPAVNNVVQNNWTDNSNFQCCNGGQCCQPGNVVVNNTLLTLGVWPTPTWPILSDAGIEPTYASVRPADTRIEAEDFNEPPSGDLDTTPGSTYTGYRDGDVDIFFCSTCSNDHALEATAGEWLRYYVDAYRPGTYDFRFRVATAAIGSSIQVEVDGLILGSVALPNTGGFSQWSEVQLPGVPLSRGPHLVRLIFPSGVFQLDWFRYDLNTFRCPTTAAPVTTVNANFDGTAGNETFRIHASPVACWEVGPVGGRPSVWYSGWGTGNFVGAGDFDGSGTDDALVIFQSAGVWYWHLGLSTGKRFEPRPNALVGWSNGVQTLIGDFDGDGKDDVVTMEVDPGDNQWHWRLAQSTGAVFAAYPNAQVGYGNGIGACVKDYDADGKDEIVVQWTPGICGNLDLSSHTFVITTPCAQTCP